ncbi:hypothetical protein BW716_23295 [[Flexibacter] sp. ATCC 35208]|nr:hypothetical protein BW716_23295 [[Flexibacter] sp. ATCC 35208]
MHKFRWVALFPVFGTVLWLIILRYRYPKSVSIDDNTVTIKYFQAFRIKYESFPLNGSKFDLDMYTRTIGKGGSTQQHYELTISTPNTKWLLSTLEGFKVKDFQGLLKYIQNNNYAN